MRPFADISAAWQILRMSAEQTSSTSALRQTSGKKSDPVGTISGIIARCPENSIFLSDIVGLFSGILTHRKLAEPQQTLGRCKKKPALQFIDLRNLIRTVHRRLPRRQRHSFRCPFPQNKGNYEMA